MCNEFGLAEFRSEASARDSYYMLEDDFGGVHKNQCTAFFKDTYGFDNVPFAAMLAVEGLVYLADALLRKRKVKSA